MRIFLAALQMRLDDIREHVPVCAEYGMNARFFGPLAFDMKYLL